MNYYYQYEASTILGNIGLPLDQKYETGALIFTVLLSILAFALVAFAAIMINRARPLGIIAAIVQPIGLFSAMKIVVSYAAIDFSCLDLKTTSSVSIEHATDLLYEKIAEVAIEKIVPDYLAMIPWFLGAFVAFVVTLIYVIQLLKVDGKKIAIASMILLILRYLFINPLESVSLLLEMGSSSIQSAWDLVFRFTYLLPLILIAIQAALILVAKLKEKKAATVAVLADDDEEETAPAYTVAAPVQTAPNSSEGDDGDN